MMAPAQAREGEEPVSRHSERMARRLERAAFADEAAALVPELRRIASKYGRKPSTVAKIAVARAQAV